eukprot:jgi/Picre1/33587/NNA_001067.t1
MRHAVQTFGVWEKTERATKQCEFCKLWFDRVDARHYRTCIFIPDEERSQKSAWLEELKKDRKRVAERERYARKRKLAAQVQGQPQSHDNAQFLPQGPILNNEEDLMDEGLDDMCMSYGGEASADAQMGMDGVTQEEVQQDEEFVDSHLTRALCDVIQAVNQKKADNLLKSIPRILRESGRTKFAQAFKDLKTFQDCVASASQRTQLTATKVLTAAGIQCYVYHVPDAKQLLHEMLLKVGQVSTRPETCTTENGASQAHGQVVYEFYWGEGMNTDVTLPDSSPWPNYSLPTSKFRDTENRKIKISSEQSANLRRLAFIACLADEALYRIIPPLKAYLDVEECINRKIHTDESLSGMHELIKKLRQEMLKAWSAVSQDLNLKILKWFSLYKFVYEVKRSGCASVTDTHHHERTHKDIKKAILRPLESNTIRQRCIAHKALTIVKSLLSRDSGLKYCVEVLYRVNLRQTSKHVPLPLDTKIEIFSGAYIPYHKTPGSEMDAKKILGRVAVIDQVNKVRNRFRQGECQESEERQEINRLVQRLGSFVTAKGNTLSEEWYAEVICFVRVTPPPTARMDTHETAFVR